jgi:hypothetical protein
MINKKWILILVVGLICLGTSFVFYGYENTYKWFGIPSTDHPFYDFELITGSADSIKNGYDPAINNPGDRGHRKFNYPRIWYFFFYFGIGKGATVLLGVASLAIFFFLLAVFPRAMDGFTISLLVLVCFSSALMLAYERANVDILFFSSIVITLLLAERSPLISLSIMVLSILFKIFPVFSSVLFLDKQKNKSIWIVIGLILFTGFYFLVDWQDMSHIMAVTQRGIDNSYGVRVAVDFLAKKKAGVFPDLSMLAYGFAGLLSITALWGGFKTRNGMADVDLYTLRAFWAGAATYVGTFWLGNNWDYRLMFLILTIPALGIYVRRNTSGSRQIALLSVAALLISCWYLFIQHWFGQMPRAYAVFYWIDELANWLLYFGLLWLLVSSLPGWVWKVRLDVEKLWLSSSK